MMPVVTPPTTPAQSLVLRAWTEGGQLRVQVSLAGTGRTAEPIVVDSPERLIEVIRAWLTLDVLGHQALSDDPFA